MSKLQEIIWTVLPAGRRGSKLRVSIALSPKLDPGTNDSTALNLAFPEFANWPVTLEGLLSDFDLEYKSPGGLVKRIGKGLVVKRVMDPKVWSALIPDGTPLQAYKTTAELALTSYPASPVARYLKHRYGTMSLLGGAKRPKRERMKTVQERLSGKKATMDGKGKAADSKSSAKRHDRHPQKVEEKLMERRKKIKGGAAEATVRASSAPGKRKDYSRLLEKIGRPDFGGGEQDPAGLGALSNYHHRQKEGSSLDAEAGATGINRSAPLFDLHTIISVARQYPDLLRWLGLVIDLEFNLPPDFSAPGGQIRLSNPQLGDLNSLDGGYSKRNIFPWTQYTLSEAGFICASSSMIDGLLPFDDTQRYDLTQIDTDGAALKELSLMESLVDAQESRSGLAAMRSAGFSVLESGRSSNVTERRKRSQKLSNSINSETKLSAEDVMRGTRIDVLDLDVPGHTPQWRSLCHRQVEYHFDTLKGSKRADRHEESEGMVVTALMGSPSGSEHFIHEGLFNWNGWALCVPEPGQPTNTLDKNWSGAGFRLKTTIEPVTPMPMLRFGHRYRFRGRMVDLAGNSPEPSVDASYTMHATEEMRYARFQPVASPVIISDKNLAIQEPLKAGWQPASPGESSEVMVIRSGAKKGKHNTTLCVRHLAPPAVSLGLAVTHGKFDVVKNGVLAGMSIASDYLAREKELPPSEHPPKETWRVNYIADPLAAGISLDGIPGSEFPQVFEFAEQNWPDVAALRLRLVPGSSGISSNGNEITIALAEAEEVTLRYSSLIAVQNLELMGIWQWTHEVANTVAADIDGVNISNEVLPAISDAAANGGNWMLTPDRPLKIVHAVARPLAEPVIIPLSAPGLTGTMTRFAGETIAELTAAVEIHGNSTGNLSITATWTDLEQAPDSELGYREVQVKVPVVEMPVMPQALLTGNPSGHGTYLPYDAQYGAVFIGIKRLMDSEKLSFAFSLPNKHDEMTRQLLEKYQLNEIVDAGIVTHNAIGIHFPDTRARDVRFQVTAATRFREYFLPARMGGKTAWDAEVEQQFMRTGPLSDAIKLPSSTPPPAPEIAYMMPIFRWERVKESRRSRRLTGIRVYLRGAWFVSGRGEQLGVVIPPYGLQAKADRGEKGRSSGSSWAQDPIWKTKKPIGLWPRDSAFKGYRALVEELYFTTESADNNLGRFKPSDGPHKIVTYDVQWDGEKKLWYADIEMTEKSAYFPFIKLALCRYQADSVRYAEMSSLVYGEFIQLLPERYLWVDVSDTDNRATAYVTGVMPIAVNAAGSHPKNIIALSVQERNEEIADTDLCWKTTSTSFLSASAELAAGRGQVNDGVVTLSASIGIPSSRPKGKYRLLVSEYEEYEQQSHHSTGSRLVYAEAVEIDVHFTVTPSIIMGPPK
ncbi:MAG: hypothetical protein OEZ16_00615 [Chromatiales bacterium]|nr:hypothetical protein [Chromatiales bacterium]